MFEARPIRRIWIFTALVVMLQLGFVQAMAVSGAFHKQCHEHADDPTHVCAVTLVLHGGYQNELPDIVPVHLVSEPPDVPVSAPKPCDTTPTHLVGGVLAQAPPRGP